MNRTDQHDEIPLRDGTGNIYILVVAKPIGQKACSTNNKSHLVLEI